MQLSKTLYKLDSKGKLRSLEIIAKDGELIQTSGLLEGRKVVHSSMCTPKNVGKSNETTEVEQAVNEAESLITKKLKEGYSETEEEALKNVVILPMLAKTFEDEKHKIDWNNCYVQPKFDGMRCLVLEDGTKISRKNTPIENMDHIVVANSELADEFGNIKTHIVDGELYVHGESFQTNMKYVKKYREGLSENIKYHIYDVVSDLPFKDRTDIASKIALQSQNCRVVRTIKITNERQIVNAHRLFISQGYEGTIVRWGNEGYHIDKRSSNLLKYKDFKDIACKIVDVLPSDKNPEQGIFECILPDTDSTFRCGMKFSHSEREKFLTNKHKYIGNTAEIRFFEYTDDGLPRFPVCVGLRLDK